MKRTYVILSKHEHNATEMYVTKKKRTKEESNNNFHNEIKFNAIKICCNNIEIRF